ncbi:response regulator [Azospirillum oleiclasticum]|uniref:Response regulator n=1 Tax=Azospirillum oleiclasticum TaxID=2735135 RepID=A0ABX2TM09_9PROT|nr:response regulator [Azospirillum oleiclasticum]NYZ24198.1 response regulator [Azospirillum oleiclasticum]
MTAEPAPGVLAPGVLAPGVLAPGVLVVDDSSMMRTLLSRLVEGGGWRLAGTAANGREAIERATALQPALCLLDLEMPVMGGLDALPAIRAVSPAAVVVVSSVAGAGSPERLACLMAGAAAVVSKPSGAVSADLMERSGRAILDAMRAALGDPSAGTEAP